MAKMTTAQLQTFVKTYVAAAKQAGAWSVSTDNKFGLVDKIGKIVTLDGNFTDKLAEFNGDELPLGKTIEEYFVDLIMPTTYSDADTTENVTPSYPSVEAAAYSYTLGRRKIKTSVKYDDLERAANTVEDFSNMTAKILERLNDSETVYKYALKKQLIGNAIDKAVTAGLDQTISAPTDTATGEAFIKQIKSDIEDASFAGENKSLNKQLIGEAPSLVFLVKKGVMPSIEVDTLAGAFNTSALAIPAKIIVVDDFGDLTNSDAWGVLLDPRGIKLHTSYRAVRNSMLADTDAMNYVLHLEHTGFISKNTYIKVYTA